MKFKERMTNLKNKKLFKKIDPISFALVVLLGASATFAGRRCSISTNWN